MDRENSGEQQVMIIQKKLESAEQQLIQQKRLSAEEVYELRLKLKEAQLQLKKQQERLHDKQTLLDQAIAEKKEAEAALKRSESRIDKLLELLGQAMQSSTASSEAVQKVAELGIASNRTLAEILESEFQHLLGKGNYQLKEAFNSILRKLDHLEQNDVLELTEADTEAFQTLLETMEMTKPGVLKAFNDVIVRGGISGVAGNLLTKGGEALFESFSTTLKDLLNSLS